MYVGRTQIYLGDDEIALLQRAERETGASRSELIRRAIRGTFGDTQAADERVAALQRTAGAWKSSFPTGSRFVETVRGDLNDRLRALGMP